ncbi:MAG: hypothetical protein J0L69_10075 [Bacteroidetes bacterium]|nr:hypothetical protein [Bacteroidota bacterium]
MKKINLIAGLICFLSTSLIAQSNSTIQDLSVEYKPDAGHQLSSENLTLCKPNIELVMAKTDSISVLYIKVFTLSTDSIVYTVHFDFSSHQHVSPAGELLYNRVDNKITISSMPILSLQPYRYEIYTADILGKPSEIFTKIQ